MESADRREYAAEMLSEDAAARLRARPGYQVVDRLGLQIADLIRSRRVSEKIQDARMRSAVESFLGERGPGYGAWAHYPWARRVVRVLPEPDFVELRTDRNRHKITAAEQARLARKKVGVVGLSVGQAVAMTVALERGCGELRLADFDTVDLSNLNRLRCGLHELGLPKTWVAARQIAELDPYLRVVCFDRGYGEDDAGRFLDGLDAVVDECDSLDMKLRLRAEARGRGIPVLMNTSDRGMTDVERFDLEPDRPFFHGRLGDTAPESVAGLSTEEKVPVVLDIIGLETSSVRLRASMLEIEQSIKTWPQLASDVALGGAAVADALRRLLLGERVASGRYYLDPGGIGAGAMPAVPPAPAEIAPAAASTLPPRSRNGDVRDRIIADAALAPSAGNAQPWQWIKTGEGLLLRHRRSPGRSMLYHEDRAAMVGLGAALESALLSAQRYGNRAELDWLWRDDDVAALALSGRPMSEPDPLYAQLARRRSVRIRPDGSAPVGDEALESLARQARRFPGIEVTFLRERKAIDALGALVGEAERLRILDPESHADLVAEIAWSESRHRCDGEGIPMSALSLSAAEAAGLRVLGERQVVAKLAEWRLGKGLGKLARELVVTSPAVGLIWSPLDDRADYLRGGRALQRLWLEATRLDLGLCPVTAICYLLRAWRRGRPMPAAQADALSAMERRFRALFALPDAHSDIVLFRLVPAKAELDRPRATFRRPG